MARLQARVLYEGAAEGPVLWLDEPLSFWGGFDPATGIIVDNNHPQSGVCIKDTILVLPSTRGSGGTPGGVAEAIRLGTAPGAIVMATGDANVMIGAAVAEKLYGLVCPVLELTGDGLASLQHAERVSVTPAGQIQLGANTR
ncbi:aconitase X swivel domain-containing protein [Anderseniella sp. Alg231-50]|uniref:aconitase X swivel domain-containing protein n=1 Tax=Anderseniella sp. Alg231-50 TaxID=1922226 RepID=UPI00307C2BF7